MDEKSKKKNQTSENFKHEEYIFLLNTQARETHKNSQKNY